MTSAGWLAVGAIAAALVAPGVGALVVLVAAVAVTIAGGQSARGRRASRATAIGAAAVALRVLVAVGPGALPTSGAPSPLPEGRGPWHGVVETRGSNREGAQPAVVRIDTGPAGLSVLVAATLPRYPDVEPGQRITFDGTIDAPPDGPYGTYLARIGVAGTVLARTLSVDGSIDGPAAALERLRRGAGDALAAAIPEPEAGLAAGIVVGLRDQVDRDLAAAYTTVGASHVVAISGWNIAIVAATVGALAGGLGRRRRAVVLVGAIVAYVLFAGASASVVRAAAMAGVVLLARETGRAGRAAAALGWAAAILLVIEPTLVTDAGFQLSSLATAGILAWADPLEQRLRRVAGGRLPGWLAESLGVSLAAQAATLPIVLATFGRLALIAPLSNLLIVPLVAPAMAAAAVALIGGAVAVLGGPALVATIAGLPAWVLLSIMDTIVRTSAAVPFASIGLDPPWSAAAGAAVVIVPVAAWRLRGRVSRPRAAAPATAVHPLSAASPAAARVKPLPGRAALIALAVAVGAVGLAAAHRPSGETRITVIDVGQGDSILVEGGRGGRMLIDGGPDPDRLIVELDRRLPPWDRRIDLLVLTHPHEDHVAGLPILLDRYRIGRVYETGMRGPGPGYAAFARDLAAHGAPPVATLSTGSRIQLDDIGFRVLWPDPGRVPREPPDAGRGINDVSIVLLGEVAGRRFLLTGDVEDDVDPILASRGIPPVDILKVAHHGSGTASTPAFVDEVRPRVAIVSAGAGNPYGHPAKSTIDRLGASGARVLRTDTDGSVAVSIEADGTIAVATTGARRVSALPIGPRLAAAPAAGPAAGLDPAQPLGRAPGLPVASAAFSCGIPSSG
ncbi:MAG TPA: ComEC/Rec2 family competence protein [Candidatus Limnocylindrales bacterium]|nr:ComEC/Rec2 family competence protein [Candidatus Limnocylindrales bacterium]